MNRTTRAAALAGIALATLTGCMQPGWDGDGVVTELELMQPEREGAGLDHDGLEITVLTDRDTEASVNVEDCDPDKISIGDHISVADVERDCGPIGFSEDD